MVVAEFLLLMASALNVSLPGSFPDVVVYFSNELRTGLQCIAKITEMIHMIPIQGMVFVPSIFLTGISCVLAEGFLLSRACVAIAYLKSPEVVMFLASCNSLNIL
ncbi:hypothetical protein MKW98_015895 [Papaver atlanticum]|uniref:Uncharacterized protein n=1 Tax=Papaver atlanticum TaxID=357466 RepID=A0AAD4XJZ9_9MAGN|nr:hypothetical protein MKW98_015895 [Papaver atlanticum]